MPNIPYLGLLQSYLGTVHDMRQRAQANVSGGRTLAVMQVGNIPLG